jgi:hypothetical protein
MTNPDARIRRWTTPEEFERYSRASMTAKTLRRMAEIRHNRVISPYANVTPYLDPEEESAYHRAQYVIKTVRMTVRNRAAAKKKVKDARRGVLSSVVRQEF